MRSERARCSVCFAGKPLHELRFVEAAIVTALLMMSIGPVAVANAQAAPAPAGQSSATPASATDIVGIWQGTVHIPQEAAIHSPGRSSSPGEFHPEALTGRVESRRAHGRCRW